MVRFVRMLTAASVAFSLAAGTAAAQGQAPAQGEIVVAQASKRGPAVRNTGTHVYLLRGFMDIFSTGMDELGSKMSRRGINATVHNHSEFQNLAAGIIDRHKRGIRENVVIIGHSLGGNDAFRMAEYLGREKINVPLIIAFDPTASMSVPSNVSRVVNFYSSTNGWGAPIVRGPGFRGSLSNVDLSRRGEMGHTDIDKSAALHSQSISYVLSIGGSRRTTDTASTPKPEARDKDAKGSDAKGTDKGTESKAAEGSSSPAPAASASAPAETKAPESAAPETTGSADAKASGEKTETAASQPGESKTSN